MSNYKVNVVKIDLTNRKYEMINIEPTVVKKYIGGSGLGTKLLCEEEIVDPLDPENPLIFMTGPFCNTPVPTSGRHQIISRSPQTGIFGEADVGGSWGTALKKAGFDGLIIKGKADFPILIKIEENNINIQDANNLWGMDTYDVSEALANKLGKKARIACIGPAAEKGCLISGIFHDGDQGRVAARCGLGAVMASKNLKAIVAIEGSGKAFIQDPQFIKDKVADLRIRLNHNGSAFNKFGTAGGMVVAESFGDLPIKNWREGSFKEGATSLSGTKMTETILTGRYACKQCPIACGRRVSVNEGPYAPVNGGGPEYETLSMLGSLCLIDNLEAVSKANELCNRYGIDTIDAGAAVGFAMECYEKGILLQSDLDGTLDWGDADGMIRIIKKIGEMEGIGKVLGKGIAKAAEEIGNHSEEFAIHVKKLAVPAHDPRCFKGLAVGYATSNRGACHLQGFTYPWERSASWAELGYESPHPRLNTAGKGMMNVRFQNAMCLADSLKICKFAFSTGMKISEIAELLRAVTGWDYSPKELLKTGDRIFNLKRIYNNKLGIKAIDDNLPPRLLSEKRGSGESADSLPELKPMLEEYYIFRGWDKDGEPTEEKLYELGLKEIKKNLKV